LVSCQHIRGSHLVAMVGHTGVVVVSLHPRPLRGLGSNSHTHHGGSGGSGLVWACLTSRERCLLAAKGLGSCTYTTNGNHTAWYSLCGCDVEIAWVASEVLGVTTLSKPSTYTPNLDVRTSNLLGVFTFNNTVLFDVLCFTATYIIVSNPTARLSGGKKHIEMPH
jgi:hypothetical protein